MPSSTRIATALVVGVAALALAAAGCGGDDAAVEETTDVPTLETDTQAPEPAETATSSATGGGAAPAPGQGTLALDDGRTYSIAVGECTFQPSGTIEVSGTTDEGSAFTMTQFHLGGEWSRTDASIELANGDRIYVMVSSATPDGEPAEVEGKTIAWEQVFQELDASANSIVYSGSGTLRLSCP
jgi:hypothetical protein